MAEKNLYEFDISYCINENEINETEDNIKTILSKYNSFKCRSSVHGPFLNKDIKPMVYNYYLTDNPRELFCLITDLYSHKLLITYVNKIPIILKNNKYYVDTINYISIDNNTKLKNNIDKAINYLLNFNASRSF